MLPHETYMSVFEKELNPNDYYIIGVDTARSLTGAYNAVEIFSFYEFNQIAEFNYRLGSFTKYGEIIDAIFRWLRSKINNNNIIITIENNTIGLAPIEHLTNHVKDIDYSYFLYREKKAKEYGISTTGVSKDLIIGCLTEILKENPKAIKSKELINQLSSIERTRGGSIGSTTFSDMFMAASFCGYTRKMKSTEILPQIKLGIEAYQLQLSDTLSQSINQSNVGDLDLNNLTNIQTISQDKEIDKLIELELKIKRKEIGEYNESFDLLTMPSIFG